MLHISVIVNKSFEKTKKKQWPWPLVTPEDVNKQIMNIYFNKNKKKTFLLKVQSVRIWHLLNSYSQ